MRMKSYLLIWNAVLTVLVLFVFARVRRHTATTHPLLPHALIFATTAQTWYNDSEIEKPN